MAIEEKDVENLAQLARMKLGEAEKKALTKDLEAILTFVDELKGADAPSHEGVSLGPVHNVFREDENPHEGGAFTKELLEEAPASEKGFVKVKNIL